MCGDPAQRSRHLGAFHAESGRQVAHGRGALPRLHAAMELTPTSRNNTHPARVVVSRGDLPEGDAAESPTPGRRTTCEHEMFAQRTRKGKQG